MGHLARLCAGVSNTYHTAGTFGPGHTTRPTAANPTRSIWTWDTTRAAANDFNAYYTTGSLIHIYIIHIYSENQISRASSVAGLWVVKHTFSTRALIQNKK